MKRASADEKLEKLPLKKLIRLAEAGDAAAQGLLGRRYAKGIGVRRDREKGLAWGRLAAKQGDRRGQALLGYYCLNGSILAKDYEQSRKWYLLSASQGYAPAQFSLGYIYQYGYGVEVCLKQAKRWYRRAARQGDAMAQLALGWLYSNEHRPRRAFYWFKRAAAGGNACAQGFVSCSYIHGDGVRKNRRAAFYWARLSAENGDYYGQYLLGKCYMNGIGHPQDYKLSLHWFRCAARQGDESAMYWVGEFYHQGMGVRKNLPRAEAWFRRGAEAGDDDAQLGLAFILDKKPGNYGEALHWYEKSAEQGNSCAQYYLFDHYMTGKLTGTRDVERAYYWIDQSAADGFEPAVKQVAEMEEFLFTDQEISRELGLPPGLFVPLRRRTYWLMFYSGVPDYEELLADLRRYIAAKPVAGYTFMEAVLWLEKQAAPGSAAQVATEDPHAKSAVALH